MLPCATGAPCRDGPRGSPGDGIAPGGWLSWGQRAACQHSQPAYTSEKAGQRAGTHPRERREGCPVVSCPSSWSLIHSEPSHNALVLPSRYGTPESTGSHQQEMRAAFMPQEPCCWSQRSAGRAGRLLNPQVSQSLQIPHWHCPRIHSPLHVHTLHPHHLHRRVPSVPG